MSLPQDKEKYGVDQRDAHSNNEIATTTEPTQSTLWGVPLKYISLVTLALQNAALAIIMHYSRVSTPSSQTYSAAAAVLMVELLKGAVSLTIAFFRITPPSMPSPQGNVAVRYLKSWHIRFRSVGAEVFSRDCWKLSIPAILYVIQNNLQYVAASNLDAATFQVTYQMKILTTALFSVILLRKRLSATKWISLLLLAAGVGIVQLQRTGASHASNGSMMPLKGLAAVTAACFTSGLAGVYFERVLKNSPGDLWVRNVQLSLFSLLPALAPLVAAGDLRSGMVITNLFANFGLAAWTTIAVQVLGGLITALVIKYSDNICKGFATSLSIIISALASVVLFDFHMSLTFTVGAAVVLFATMLYAQPDSTSWTEGRRWPLSRLRQPALSRSTSTLGRASAALMASLPGSPTEESLPMFNYFDREKTIERESTIGRSLKAAAHALGVSGQVSRNNSAIVAMPELTEARAESLVQSAWFSNSSAQRIPSRVPSQLPSRVHSPSPLL